jgi:hypothetical protein
MHKYTPQLKSNLNPALPPNNSGLQDTPNIKHTLERASYPVNYWGLSEQPLARPAQPIDIYKYLAATSPSMPEQTSPQCLYNICFE